GGIDLGPVQDIGDVRINVVVGEQRATNVAGGAVGAQDFAAALSASCWSKGLPPGGANSAQLPGCIWTRPTMPPSCGVNIPGLRPKSVSSFSRPARMLQSSPHPDAAAACCIWIHWSIVRSLPAFTSTSELRPRGHAAIVIVSIAAISSTSAASKIVMLETNRRTLELEAAVTATLTIISSPPSLAVPGLDLCQSQRRSP